MKLENQCCTREQSKRLKELGISQNSTEYFLKGVDDLYTGTFLKRMANGKNDDNASSAFTVAELGVLLSAATLGVMLPVWNGAAFSVDISLATGWDYNCFEFEAQARAAMLIYLLENNLVTAEECNTRLNA